MPAIVNIDPTLLLKPLDFFTPDCKLSIMCKITLSVVVSHDSLKVWVRDTGKYLDEVQHRFLFQIHADAISLPV